MADRYYETETSVFFVKTGMVFHKSFSHKYKGLSIVQARRVLGQYFTRSQQDEILHYLKDKHHISII